MVRFLIFSSLMLATACAEGRYSKPIATSQHGAAVRANMAAQIIDPNPPAATSNRSDAARAVIGVTAYRTDEVKPPADKGASPSSGASE